MIKGDRVYLRLLEKSDLNMLYNMCNDDNVNRYNTVLPEKKYLVNNFYVIKNIKNKILSIVNEKNVVIGFVDYRSYSPSIYTIGITIGKRFWGRGYGSESIRTLTNYLFDEIKAKEIIVEVISKNTRAIKCYKACGFIEKELIKKNNGSTVIKMCLLKDE